LHYTATGSINRDNLAEKYQGLILATSAKFLACV
jgi:hypothetical protein